MQVVIVFIIVVFFVIRRHCCCHHHQHHHHRRHYLRHHHHHHRRTNATSICRHHCRHHSDNACRSARRTGSITLLRSHASPGHPTAAAWPPAASIPTSSCGPSQRPIRYCWAWPLEQTCSDIVCVAACDDQRCPRQRCYSRRVSSRPCNLLKVSSTRDACPLPPFPFALQLGE
jgi:hypothetical protein